MSPTDFSFNKSMMLRRRDHSVFVPDFGNAQIIYS